MATEGITNSHIDMVAALLLVVATLLVASRRPIAAAASRSASSISTKLIPVIGSFALLRRNPVKVIVAAIAIFALLYVPYVLVSGIDVLGYLPGYLSEEGYDVGQPLHPASPSSPRESPPLIVVSGAHRRARRTGLVEVRSG